MDGPAHYREAEGVLCQAAATLTDDELAYYSDDAGMGDLAAAQVHAAALEAVRN